MSSKIIKVESPDALSAVFGSCDANVKLIEKKLGVSIHNRIADSGEDVIVVSAESEEAVSLGAKAVAYRRRRRRTSFFPRLRRGWQRSSPRGRSRP